MIFTEFCDYVTENIANYFPESMNNAEVFRMEKNLLNGGVMHGVSIRGEGITISPCIYLDDVFASYEKGLSEDDICKEIALRMEKEVNTSFSVDLSRIMEFQYVKENITTKVVNARDNRELLETRPHTDISDLAVIYQIEVRMKEESSGTIAVDNNLMESWGVSLDELHKAAVANSEQKDGYVLCGIENMLFMLNDTNYLNNDSYDEQCGIMVLTNTSRVFGANVLANEQVLSKVTEVVGDDIYILPSSIHEVLVIPKKIADKTNMDLRGLGRMVREINEAEVRPEERLSDHIYEVNREDMELKSVSASKEKQREAVR